MVWVGSVSRLALWRRVKQPMDQIDPVLPTDLKQKNRVRVGVRHGKQPIDQIVATVACQQTWLQVANGVWSILAWTSET